jgi:hypothetical protein
MHSWQVLQLRCCMVFRKRTHEAGSTGQTSAQRNASGGGRCGIRHRAGPCQHPGAGRRRAVKNCRWMVAAPGRPLRSAGGGVTLCSYVAAQLPLVGRNWAAYHRDPARVPMGFGRGRSAHHCGINIRRIVKYRSIAAQAPPALLDPPFPPALSLLPAGAVPVRAKCRTGTGATRPPPRMGNDERAATLLR